MTPYWSAVAGNKRIAAEAQVPAGAEQVQMETRWSMLETAYTRASAALVRWVVH